MDLSFAAYDAVAPESHSVVVCAAAVRCRNEVWGGTLDGSINVWDAQTAALKETVPHLHGLFVVRMVALDDTGHVAVALADHSVRIFLAETREQQLHLQCSSRVFCLHVAHDVLWAGNLGQVRAWRLDSWESKKFASIGAAARSLASHGSNLWCGADDGGIRVYNVKSGAHVTTLAQHTGTVRCLLVVHATDTVWSAGRDGKICVWGATSCAQENEIAAHRRGVLALESHEQLRHVFSSAEDCHVRLWSADTYQCIRVVATLARPALQIIAVGSLMWAPSADGLQIWTAAGTEATESRRTSLALPSVSSQGRNSVLATDGGGSVAGAPASPQSATEAMHEEGMQAAFEHVLQHLRPSKAAETITRMCDARTGIRILLGFLSPSHLGSDVVSKCARTLGRLLEAFPAFSVAEFQLPETLCSLLDSARKLAELSMRREEGWKRLPEGERAVCGVCKAVCRIASVNEDNRAALMSALGAQLQRLAALRNSGIFRGAAAALRALNLDTQLADEQTIEAIVQNVAATLQVEGLERTVQVVHGLQSLCRNARLVHHLVVANVLPSVLPAIWTAASNAKTDTLAAVNGERVWAGEIHDLLHRLLCCVGSENGGVMSPSSTVICARALRVLHRQVQRPLPEQFCRLAIMADIVAFLASRSNEVICLTLASLADLAKAHEVRALIIESNVLAHFPHLLSFCDSATHVLASGLLANLCASTGSALSLIGNVDLVSTLAAFCRGPETALLRAATLAAANCATAAAEKQHDESTRRFFEFSYDAGLPDVLAMHVQHADAEVSCNALRAMIHLCRDEHITMRMIELRVHVSALMSVRAWPDKNIAVYAAVWIGSAAEHEVAAAVLLENKAIEALVDVARQRDNEFIWEAATLCLANMARFAGVASQIITLLDLQPFFVFAESLRNENSTVNLLKTLASICVQDRFMVRKLTKPTVSLLILVLMHGTAKTREYALISVTRIFQKHTVPIRSEFASLLGPVAVLIASGTTHERVLALRASRAVILAKGGWVGPVLHSAIVAAVLWCVSYLDVDVRLQACRTVEALTEMRASALLLSELGVERSLIATMQRNPADESLVQSITLSLSYICRNFSSVESNFCTAELVTVLVELLSHPTRIIMSNAALCLAYLSRAKQHHPLLLRLALGKIHALLEPSPDVPEEAHVYCVNFLHELCANDASRRHITEVQGELFHTTLKLWGHYRHQRERSVIIEIVTSFCSSALFAKMVATTETTSGRYIPDDCTLFAVHDPDMAVRRAAVLLLVALASHDATLHVTAVSVGVERLVLVLANEKLIEAGLRLAAAALEDTSFQSDFLRHAAAPTQLVVLYAKLEGEAAVASWATCMCLLSRQGDSADVLRTSQCLCTLARALAWHQATNSVATILEALVNLSSSAALSALDDVVAAGAVAQAVELLMHAHPQVQMLALSLLVNTSCIARAQEAIVSKNISKTLVQLLTYDYQRTGVLACGVISNIAQLATGRRQLLACGILEKLVKVLSGAVGIHVSLVSAALTTLQRYVANDGIDARSPWRARIVAAVFGVLKPDDGELSELCLDVLVHLHDSESLQAVDAQHPLPTLRRLLKSASPTLCAHAATVLVAVSKSESRVNLLVTAGYLARMLQVLRSESALARREVAVALQRLCRHARKVPLLATDGLVDGLADVLARADEDVVAAREACKAVAFLCASDVGRQRVVARDELLRRLVLLTFSPDRETRGAASGAVGNVAMDAVYVGNLVEASAVATMLPHMLLGPGDELQLNAAKTLANICRSEMGRAAVVAGGGCLPLVLASMSPNDDVRPVAVVALAELCWDAEHAAAVTACGGVQPLLETARNDVRSLQYSLRALALLCGHATTRADVDTAAAIELALVRRNHESKEVRDAAELLIANCRDAGPPPPPPPWSPPVPGAQPPPHDAATTERDGGADAADSEAAAGGGGATEAEAEAEAGVPARPSHSPVLWTVAVQALPAEGRVAGAADLQPGQTAEEQRTRRESAPNVDAA